MKRIDRHLLVILLATAACTGARTTPTASTPASGPRAGGGCALSSPEEAAAFGSPDDPYRDEVLAWPTGDPEAEGLDPALLAQIEEDVGLSSTIRSFLVIRNGTLVTERYFHDGGGDKAFNVHSVSKSLLSLIVGAALDDGAIPDLDTPIAELLPANLASEPGVDGLTVRLLLEMSGGLDVDDAASIDQITGPSHARSVLRQTRVSEPGVEFSYNTGMSHVLAVATANAVGSPLCDYAQERLFDPMGITVDHWHSDPEGYFTGGTSMFLTPRELARVGQFTLQRGQWDGQQILPSSWIDEITSEAWDLGCRPPDRPGYGYLWWLNDVAGFDMWAALGFGGQSIAIIPELDLVVVMTQKSEGWPVEQDVVRPNAVVRRVIGAVTDRPVDATTSACPAGDVYRARADGSDPVRLTDQAPIDIAYSWSPDGERIAFLSERDLNPEIYTMAADGSDVQRLTRDFDVDLFPAWSPDGGEIAFASDRGGTFDIYVMAVDGSGQRALTDFPRDEIHPTWSPDGTRIAFIRSEVPPGGYGPLWVMDADGSHARLLLKDPLVEFPAWSPDGTQIAFGMSGSGGSHIGVLDIRTGDVSDLGPGTLPRWSPHGKRLVVSTTDYSEIEIVTIADGSRTTILAGSAPVWSPEGSWIAFSRSE